MFNCYKIRRVLLISVTSLNKPRLFAQISPLCEERKTRFLPSPLLFEGTKPSFKRTLEIAKLPSSPSSAVRAPKRSEIVSSQHGNPAQTLRPLILRNHLQDSFVSFSSGSPPAVLLVHAPTIPNWVRPVAGPLYRVSKYFFTFRNPPGTYTESPSLAPSSPLSPRCFRTKGMRACISKRPTE